MHPSRNSNTKFKEPRLSTPSNNQNNVRQKGTIVKYHNENANKASFGFIRCKEDDNNNNDDESKSRTRDFYFNYDFAMQSNGIEPQVGDEVEFRIRQLNAKRRGDSRECKATNIIITHLNQRSYKVLVEYITYIKTLLTDEETFQQSLGTSHREKQETESGSSLIQIISAPGVWHGVAEQVAAYARTDREEGYDELQELLEVLILIHERVYTLHGRFKQVMVAIMKDSNHNSFTGAVKMFVKENQHKAKKWVVIHKFLLVVGKYVPEKCSVLTTIVKPLMANPKKETSRFLYKLLKALSKGSAGHIHDLEWKNLPLSLRKEEMESNFEDDNFLNPVQVAGEYQSADDYFDTYFRLLREDCFYRLKNCIKDHLNGTLGKISLTHIK